MNIKSGAIFLLDTVRHYLSPLRCEGKTSTLKYILTVTFTIENIRTSVNVIGFILNQLN